MYLETFSQIDKELGLHFYATDSPGLGGKIKERPEDFVVIEDSIIEPEASGNHMVLVIWKKDLSTREIIDLLVEKLRIGRRAIGVAGLKDKRAIAVQKISIPYTQIDLMELEVDGHLKILKFFRARRKVRVGYLRGNFFRIRIRDVRNIEALDETISQLEERGCPNYYGYQRFGGRTRNHELGRLIIDGHYDLLAERMGLKRKIVGIKDVLRLDLRLLRFFINAYQSYLFNLMVSERMRRGHPLKEQIDGDFVKGDKPALPIIGYKSKLPKGEAGDIVESILDKERVKPEDFKVEIRKLRDKGSLRKIPMNYRFLKTDRGDSEVSLSFWLEKGCYATVLLREICKWSEPPV